MNDMRDLENGFKREPLGVGVGDWGPEPDDREALADVVSDILDALHFEPSTRDGEHDTVADILRAFRRPEPDTISLSLHNALIEQERQNAATRREARDREWRARLAERGES